MQHSDAIFLRCLRVNAKISSLYNKKLSVSGGSPPDLLIRGSASGPRWGYSPRLPTSSPNRPTSYFSPDVGRLVFLYKTLIITMISWRSHFNDEINVAGKPSLMASLLSCSNALFFCELPASVKA